GGAPSRAQHPCRGQRRSPGFARCAQHSLRSGRDPRTNGKGRRRPCADTVAPTSAPSRAQHPVWRGAPVFVCRRRSYPLGVARWPSANGVRTMLHESQRAAGPARGTPVVTPPVEPTTTSASIPQVSDVQRRRWWRPRYVLYGLLVVLLGIGASYGWQL